MKRFINILFFMLLMGVVLISSFFLYLKIKENKKYESEFDDLITIVEENRTTENAKINVKQYDLNNDFVGWLKIDGTNINYPVMQTKDRPNYYLKRNFYKQYSSYGTPYIAEQCDIETGDNIIIYRTPYKK